MKDKIVKFFNNIKNYVIKFSTKFKGHFVKYKQRYMRVLLVILCVYLVLLALCSIGRCTRKNVLTADALGENTDTYFEFPVVMLYNSATWYEPTTTLYVHSCVISNPIYIRLSRNLDFLGVTSITSDGSDEFIPSQSPTYYSYDGLGCTYVKGIVGSSMTFRTSSLDCNLSVEYVDRVYGSYPAINRVIVFPDDDRTLHVELVNSTANSHTLICAFDISVMTPNGTSFIFLDHDVGYNFSASDTYANGYAAGTEAGYNEGYSRGYANGSQTVGDENQFTALMNAIVFVPINALWNVLNFDLLGVNVFMFVTAVITVLVVFWLWGKMK